MREERHEALAGVAATLPSRSLADAAVHVGLAWFKLNKASDWEMSLDDLRVSCRRSLCLLSSALPFVADAAGVPINELGASTYLDQICAIRLREDGFPVAGAFAADPDADLIAACEEAINLDRECERRGIGVGLAGEERFEAELAPLHQRIEELVAFVADAGPSTREAEHAMARLAVQFGDGPAPNGGPHDTVAWSLIDVLARRAPQHALRAAAIDPDAELIRACAEFDALQRRCDGTATPRSTAREEDAMRAQQACTEAQWPLLDLICAARPVTVAGHRARMASLALLVRGSSAAMEHVAMDERLAAAILRDFGSPSEATTAEPVTERFDAELIQVGQEATALNAEMATLYDGVQAHTPEWRSAFQREGEINGRRNAIVDAQAPAATATTLAGLRAKAELIRSAVKCGLANQEGPTTEESALAWSVVLDVLQLMPMPLAETA